MVYYMVYYKTAIGNCWSSRASSLGINTATIHKIHSCEHRHTSVDLAFITDAAPKILKKNNVFADNGLPCACIFNKTLVELMLSSN